MLNLQNISWTAPDHTPVLHNINLVIKKGRLTVLTGPNGSGKTTLFKLVAGLLPAQSGRILLDGEDITPLDVTQRARQGVCLAFQQPVSFKGLTIGRLLELAAGEALDEGQRGAILDQVGLAWEEYQGRPADGSLSGGERKRVEIATVLARPGRLLLFDEPEAGLDLWSLTGLLSVFHALRERRDKGLLLISHQARLLEAADEIVVLAGGRIVGQGPPARVLPSLAAENRGPLPRGGGEAQSLL